MMARARKYWLLKTEPETYSIDDLANEPEQTTCWDGVRNYQARNMMRDEMKKGDQVLLYHSNAKPPSVVGIAKIVRESYPDHTSWDPQDKHFDEKSTPENPRWFMVDIRLVKKFRRAVGLDELKATVELDGMELLRKGSRLSVQPVTPDEFKIVTGLASKRNGSGQVPNA